MAGPDSASAFSPVLSSTIELIQVYSIPPSNKNDLSNVDCGRIRTWWRFHLLAECHQADHSGRHQDGPHRHMDTAVWLPGGPERPMCNVARPDGRVAARGRRADDLPDRTDGARKGELDTLEVHLGARVHSFPELMMPKRIAH